MESLDKLRELAADINSAEIIDHLDVVGKFVFRSEWLDSWHKAFNRELENLEREIADRYMERPCDMDGRTLFFGDEIEYTGPITKCEFDRRITVRRFTIQEDSSRNGIGDYHTSFAPSECRYVKPRTIEDVLRELLRDTAHYFPSDCEDDIARAADEIRGLL
jgi:hypothetical protein